jgi:hypothetical protein
MIKTFWELATYEWVQESVRRNGEGTSGELIVPHKKEANQSAFAVGRSLKDLPFGGGFFDSTVQLNLLPHLVKFFPSECVMRVALCPMEAFDDFVGFIEAVLHHEPTRAERQPWRADKKEQGWDHLERDRESPGKGRIRPAGGNEVHPEPKPGRKRVADGEHDTLANCQ